MRSESRPALSYQCISAAYVIAEILPGSLIFILWDILITFQFNLFSSFFPILFCPVSTITHLFMNLCCFANKVTSVKIMSFDKLFKLSFECCLIIKSLFKIMCSFQGRIMFLQLKFLFLAKLPYITTGCKHFTNCFRNHFIIYHHLETLQM